MVRPFLILWPIWLGAFVWLAALGVCFWLSGPFIGLLAIPVLFDPLPVRQFRWVWRFCRQIGEFRTVAEQRIILHYSPELDGQWDFSVLLQRCREELDDLSEQFG